MRVHLASILSFLCVTACGDPMSYFHKELKKYGYIPYSTPLQFAGTGTLIGGNATSMSLVAPPQSCFPDFVNGDEATNLRHRDETTLPTNTVKIMVDVQSQATFFLAMLAGSPTIKAGARIHDVTNFSVEFKGVHIESMNAIRLTQFYNEQMSSICKDYLTHVAFIIQAFKADEMKYTFYNKNNSAIELTLDNIQEFLDLSVDAHWEIEKNTTLVITTPKYLGYQLGRLKPEDRGVSLYRASEVLFNKWQFKNIGVFKSKNQPFEAFNANEEFFQSIEEVEEAPVAFKNRNAQEKLD